MSTGPVSATHIARYDNDHQSTEDQTWLQSFHPFTHNSIPNDVHNMLKKIEEPLRLWHQLTYQQLNPFESYDNSSNHVGNKKHHHHHALIQSHASKVMEEKQKKKLLHRLEKLRAELEAEELKAEEYHQLSHSDKIETLKLRIKNLESKRNELIHNSRINNSTKPSGLQSVIDSSHSQLSYVEKLLREMNQNIKNGIT